jgi:L-histidine N-alpha-methyltransferase
MSVQPNTLLDTFAADVACDLRRTPKQLQARYLYDTLGSTLFDAICELPWYRITRAEARLLERYAGRIAAHTQRAPEFAIIELGVGNGEKLATLVGAVSPDSIANLHLVDISDAALQRTSARLSYFPNVSIERYQGTYEEGLERVALATRGSGRKLLLFLGSNIGNFDAEGARDLMRSMRGALEPGDVLLLGADLVKPAGELILAYDDPLGVTAAFNKNLLVRINRELGGDFDLARFAHRADWNASEQRIEMHLVSQRPQDVRISAIGLHTEFVQGETIWTESSYKYDESSIERLGAAAGFSVIEQWTDPDARFALTLFEAI